MLCKTSRTVHDQYFVLLYKLICFTNRHLLRCFIDHGDLDVLLHCLYISCQLSTGRGVLYCVWQYCNCDVTIQKQCLLAKQCLTGIVIFRRKNSKTAVLVYACTLCVCTISVEPKNICTFENQFALYVYCAWYIKQNTFFNACSNTACLLEYLVQPL